MNRDAVENALTLSLALGCGINRTSYFARKHYFYPDLPKGYQISQHEIPICSGGLVQIRTDSGESAIPLHHIHIEEDAGKSIHPAGEKISYIDLNRAGMPLLEIVSEPAIHSPEEAHAYVTELRRLVRWLDICDGNMEKGSMRCDANISIRRRGDKELGTRVEVKNLNSIRHVKKAIEFEWDRMITLAERGEPIRQETRSFDDEKGTTFLMRTKEDAEDYRYFPDPDLPPLVIGEEWIQRCQTKMPQLPRELEKELRSSGINEYDSSIICEDKDLAIYFAELIRHTGELKAAANWIIGPVRKYFRERNVEIILFPLKPEKLARLIDLTSSGKINFTNGSGRLFLSLTERPEADALILAAELNLIQESDDSATEVWIKEVLEKMPEKVKEYRSGKKGLIGLFAGEVKKLSKGKANMEKVTTMLSDLLNSH
jgi:aspartyl-tRNA(Asn)/glutamyl-tRNA(Gln) amidotransferase subunit B